MDLEVNQTNLKSYGLQKIDLTCKYFTLLKFKIFKYYFYRNFEFSNEDLIKFFYYSLTMLMSWLSWCCRLHGGLDVALKEMGCPALQNAQMRRHFLPICRHQQQIRRWLMSFKLLINSKKLNLKNTKKIYA
jgi:hypothetical protein